MLNSSGFDLWANEYDHDVALRNSENRYPFAGYQDVLSSIYKRIGENGGRKVLDIGFGTAILSKKLYDDGMEITGIDFSNEMIKTAREKMPEARLIQYDFSAGLPGELIDEKFDDIICTYAIHHLTDDEKIRFIHILQDHLETNGEILFGDVIFASDADLEKCRESSGEDWDKNEIYIVVDRFRKQFPQMKFIKISDCSGICIIK